MGVELARRRCVCLELMRDSTTAQTVVAKAVYSGSDPARNCDPTEQLVNERSVVKHCKTRRGEKSQRRASRDTALAKYYPELCTMYQ